MSSYERLSAIDSSFLLLESSRTPMHVGATCVFEGGPLLGASGAVDAGAIRQLMLASIARIPRYRQRLAWIPLENHPVWVADDHFQIDYHVRHTALPHPGGDAELKRLAARILEQPLDRGRPLWELWIVEGLGGGRFATIHKVHHCLADGASGVDLMQTLLQDRPDAEVPTGHALQPAAAPSPLELFGREALRRSLAPLRAVTEAPHLLSELGDRLSGLRGRARSLARATADALHPPPLAPFNGPLSPHRRVDWFTSDFDELHDAAGAFGATVNDVVLAIVAGAVTRYLESWGELPEEHAFRVAVPVNARDGAHTVSLGNELSAWFVDLPLAEPDVGRRIRLIRDQTRASRRRQRGLDLDTLAEAASLLPAQLVSATLRGVLSMHPFNMVVSNIPGPPLPLYTLGARLCAVHPHLMLADPLGLAIAVMSYDGGLHWGLIADYDRVADLEDFTRMLRESEEELRKVSAHRRQRRASRVDFQHEEDPSS